MHRIGTGTDRELIFCQGGPPVLALRTIPVIGLLPIRTDGIYILQPDPHRLELKPLPCPPRLSLTHSIPTLGHN